MNIIILAFIVGIVTGSLVVLTGGRGDVKTNTVKWWNEPPFSEMENYKTIHSLGEGRFFSESRSKPTTKIRVLGHPLEGLYAD